MTDFDRLKGQPKMDSVGRWPTPANRTDAPTFHRFPSRFDNPFDRRTLVRHYEDAMRLAFKGRNVEVLDHELKMLVSLQQGEIGSETGRRPREARTFPREFFKLKMDAWIKEPDPMVTAWERFKLWLARKPLPKAAEPDRIVVYYSMSCLQADIFRRLWADSEFN